MDLLGSLRNSQHCTLQAEVVIRLEALVRYGWSEPFKPSCSTGSQGGSMEHSPGSPSPWALGQAWGGELGGRSTGAKALLCLTAEIMLTGEKEKTLVVGAAAGRDTEEAAASGGLEGMTPGRGGEGQVQQGRKWETQQGDSTRVSSSVVALAWAVCPVRVADLGPHWGQRRRRGVLGRPV